MSRPAVLDPTTTLAEHFDEAWLDELADLGFPVVNGSVITSELDERESQALRERLAGFIWGLRAANSFICELPELSGEVRSETRQRVWQIREVLLRNYAIDEFERQAMANLDPEVSA